jgi:m7GpppX diphosphatase
MESKLILDESKYQLTFKKLINTNDKYKKYFIEALITGTMIEEPIINKKQNKIINESYNDYLLLDVKNIDKTWIYNIIDHLNETENILFENNNVIYIPDYKWNNDIKNLHILGIFKDKSLYSIRELNGNHINMLENIIEDGKRIIKEKYKVDNIIVYFHYHPSTWQLHIHFMNIESNSESYLLPRGHLASNIIQNLKIDSEYYSKVTLEVLI